MGYFPNGSEGADYEDRYCRRCVHYGPESGPGCPVWGLHLLWNSEQIRDGKAQGPKATALGAFIPISADGLSNEQCTMFHAATADELAAQESPVDTRVTCAGCWRKVEPGAVKRLGLPGGLPYCEACEAVMWRGAPVAPEEVTP